MNIASSFASKVQSQETQFRDSISEGFFNKVGAIINEGIDRGVSVPVGTIEVSMLEEADFLAIRGSGWVLANGQSAVGTAFQTLTGKTNVPDFRGRFIRSLQPSTLLNPGDTQDDDNIVHTHGISYTNTDAIATSFDTSFKKVDDSTANKAVFNPANFQDVLTVNLLNDGTPENRMQNVTVNIFIRVN